MVSLGIPWYLLVSLGISWYLLVSPGISRYLLVSLGISWYLQVSLGTCIPWYLTYFSVIRNGNDREIEIVRIIQLFSSHTRGCVVSSSAPPLPFTLKITHTRSGRYE